MNLSILRVGVLVCGTAAAFACAGNGSPAPAAEPLQAAPTPAAVEAGDRLTLQVWGEPDLKGEMIVDPAGTVSLPRGGVLRVTTIPVVDIRDSIRSRLSDFIRDPNVDLQIERRVVVNGAVTKPGVYFMDINSTLRDAIAQGGGISESGSQSKVAILRGDRRIPVPNWQDNSSTVAQLQSGDQVVVGRRSWLAANAFSVASLSLVMASFIISLRR
jgi:polysaccharide export outer membrane protein